MSTKIQVSIIDDEKNGRDYIALLLANEFPELEITFQASTIEDAYLLLVKKQPDILFLDIELADGNSFELLDKLQKISSRIIFITAYEQFAIRAIRRGATDYLLKPIKQSDFVMAVNTALETIRSSKQLIKKDALPATINLPTQQGFKRILISDIVRCEADSNYTFFYLSDKSKIIVSKTMRDFEDLLLEHDFFRTHHKHLINLRHFKEYLKGKTGRIILSDDSVIDLSLRRKNDFMKRIQNPD
jgi:two-component system LytT family response regulator